MTNQEINEQVARKLGFTCNCECHEKMTYACVCGYRNRCKNRIPNYTGSIQAAWEIVEHQKYAFSLARDAQYPLWDAWFAGGDHVQADTAPLAIALCFLKLKD